MTDRRPLLRAIFDTAVAAAHPEMVLAAHLRPVPKGRVICLAAGKGAAAMARLRNAVVTRRRSAWASGKNSLSLRGLAAGGLFLSAPH